MRTRASLAAILSAFALAVAGCGGDNLALCEGCGTPTPRPSTTPTATVTPGPDGLPAASD